MNQVLWFAIHVFIQTHEGESSFFKKRYGGFYTFKEAKIFYDKLIENFEVREGQYAAQYFIVRKIKYFAYSLNQVFFFKKKQISNIPNVEMSELYDKSTKYVFTVVSCK